MQSASIREGMRYNNIRNEGFRTLRNNMNKNNVNREGFTSAVDEVNTHEKRERIRLVSDVESTQTQFIQKINQLDEILKNYPIKNANYGNTIVSTSNATGYITNLGKYKPANKNDFTHPSCSDVKKIDENIVSTGNTVLVGNDSNAMTFEKGTNFKPGAPCNSSGTNVYVKQDIRKPTLLKSGPYANGTCKLSAEQYSNPNIERTLKGMGKVINPDDPYAQFTRDQCMEQAGIQGAKFFALQRQELGEEGKYDCWVGNGAYGDDIKVNKIDQCYYYGGHMTRVNSETAGSEAIAFKNCKKFSADNGYKYFGIQQDNYQGTKNYCYVSENKDEATAYNWATSKGVTTNWAGWTIDNGGPACNPCSQGNAIPDCGHGTCVYNSSSASGPNCTCKDGYTKDSSGSCTVPPPAPAPSPTVSFSSPTPGPSSSSPSCSGFWNTIGCWVAGL